MTSASDIDKSVTISTANDSFDLVDENERSLVKIGDFVGEWDADNTSDLLDEDSISKFNHLLGILPDAATASAAHSKKLMTCSFEYSQLMQAKDGSGALGGVVHSDSNKFSAQARFHDADNMKSMANFNTAFNLVSQLVAQKHLADISERLKAIEAQINGVKEHLNEVRRSKIVVFHEQLTRVGPLIAKGKKIAPETLQTLSIKAQDVRESVSHLHSDLKKGHQDIKDFNAKRLYESNTARKQLLEKIDEIHHLHCEYLLGLKCLLMANLMLFVKNGGYEEYLLAADTYFSELSGKDGVASKWASTKNLIVSDHLTKMNPMFESDRSYQANKLIVEKRVSKVDAMLTLNTKQLTEINARLLAARSTRVVLEIEHGEVIRGRYLT